MRRLHPPPATDVDAYDAYRPGDPDAPLLRVNMVTALDGHIVGADGVSGTLGADGDAQVFFALRNMADGILVGAGTVRAEAYGPMKVRPALRARREADGRTGPAPVVIVTRSVRLDTDSPVFSEAETPTMVLTSAAAPADRVAAVEEAGGVVVHAGDDDVDLAGGLRTLRDDHGLAHLLCEGGPTLNGQLFDAGLVDELCVTVAPVLAGGDDEKRIVAGLVERHDMALARVLEHDGELFLTYRRA